MNADLTDAKTAITIVNTAAATPAFANLDALFAAWCAAEGPTTTSSPLPTAGSLCRQTLDALNAVNPLTPTTGLLLATTKGEMADQVAWMRRADTGDHTPPPTLADPLTHLIAAYRLQGPSHVVSTACTSGLVALIDAAFLLLDRDADHMITLGVDIAGDFVQDGFTALHALSPTRCRPFDTARDGLTLGSAAAACLLTRSPTPAAACLLTRSPTPTATCLLTGWGISNDAAHMTAPDRHAAGLIRAIRQALHHANLAPTDIDVIFAHGTGTRYNDAMEAAAIDKIFLQNASSPAVTAAKGFLGHTLGAAGILEAMLAVEMLRRQLIPPVTGLLTPERTDIDFVRSPRPHPIRHILKIASGFGGMNAAIILSRGGA